MRRKRDRRYVDPLSVPSTHRVTGSEITRVKRRLANRTVEVTVVTVRCACGATVTGEDGKLSSAENKARIAYNAHKR